MDSGMHFSTRQIVLYESRIRLNALSMKHCSEK